tara:strand:- start:13188 stop:13964 length:777 start_codon:yes stop_codon:yes gene_type:complete
MLQENEMGDLEEKIILVTGGSRGIGAEIVRQSIKEGAKVILHYGKSHDAAISIQDEVGKDKCQIISADLMKNKEILSLWEKSWEWRGRIDVLVNNAGIYEPVDVADNFTDWTDAWSKTLQINLLATAHLSRLAILAYRECGGGTIINITSRAAFRGDTHFHMHYAASKGGQTALTSTISRGYGGDGITCYSIAPGWVDTEMAREGAEKVGWDYVLKDLPLGEMVPPREVANVAVFMASGKARHLTGSSVSINGGSFPR